MFPLLRRNQGGGASAAASVRLIQKEVRNLVEDQSYAKMKDCCALLWNLVQLNHHQMMRCGIPTRSLFDGQCTVVPDESDIFCLGVVCRPAEGHWAGGRIEFSLTLPSDYPFSPPKMVCISPVFHPNIDSKGAICLR